MTEVASADARPPGVALVGASGHGLWHRRTIQALVAAGRARLVGLCDTQPVQAAPDAPIDGVPVFTDHRTLLSEARPCVVVICTPPHTHLRIAVDALAAGADVLLEKPPVTTLGEHRRLLTTLAGTGRACQVNFQALGSAALAELLDATTAGRLGDPTALSAAGAWWRPDTYWSRSPWAGRARVGGRPSLDGALANPFAHAVMQCLAVADGVGLPDPVELAVERYRTRRIEVDDTAFLRLRYPAGQTLTVAVSLCSTEFIAGEVLVRGTGGEATLEYPTDRLRLPEQRDAQPVPGRVGMLANLLDHRADPRVPLIVPVARTAPFTRLMEVLRGAPPPTRIPDRYLRPHPDGTGRVIEKVADAVRAAARRAELPAESGVPWATEPYVVALPERRVHAQVGDQ